MRGGDGSVRQAGGGCSVFAPSGWNENKGALAEKFIFNAPVRLAFPVRLRIEGQRSPDPADREPWSEEKITHASD